jgi:hypothetical protein
MTLALHDCGEAAAGFALAELTLTIFDPMNVVKIDVWP